MQVSASRTDIGAVLPVGFILLSMSFSMSMFLHSGAFVSRPSKASLGLSFLCLLYSCEDGYIFLFLHPACSSALSCPSFNFENTNYLPPGSRRQLISWRLADKPARPKAGGALCLEGSWHGLEADLLQMTPSMFPPSLLHLLGGCIPERSNRQTWLMSWIGTLIYLYIHFSNILL